MKSPVQMADFELMRYIPNKLWCAVQRPFKIMKHIHLPWAFFVKSGILRTSVYNVYGSQNEFVSSVTRVFILRLHSLGQNGPLRRDAVFAVARIEVELCYSLYVQKKIIIHKILTQLNI